MPLHFAPPSLRLGFGAQGFLHLLCDARLDQSTPVIPIRLKRFRRDMSGDHLAVIHLAMLAVGELARTRDCSVGACGGSARFTLRADIPVQASVTNEVPAIRIRALEARRAGELIETDNALRGAAELRLPRNRRHIHLLPVCLSLLLQRLHVRLQLCNMLLHQGLHRHLPHLPLLLHRLHLRPQLASMLPHQGLHLLHVCSPLVV